jgi:hypothetical protein
MPSAQVSIFSNASSFQSGLAFVTLHLLVAYSYRAFHFHTAANRLRVVTVPPASASSPLVSDLFLLEASKKFCFHSFDLTATIGTDD